MTEYGYCLSHSRNFWRLRVHLIATLHGLLIASMLTGATAGRAPDPAVGPARTTP